ncbi:MAG TPA: Sec-independent protein translocase protein TatB [Pseudolabrys sp.]|jgi:sec-independent protein translocase protein TatB|nr:Sec-independent protein translocase protein TatB [Pseudolabrys sp.]
MFGIGWSEFVVIGVVALIAIGPKELPGVLRMVGQSLGKVRRMANEFQGQFQEAMREAEMADVRKELDDLSKSATDIGNIDPVADAKASSEIDRVVSESAAEVTPVETTPVEVAPPAEPTPLPAPPSPVEAAAEPEKKAG